ncbi:hypothetical protein FA95DRAFT_1612541 [Auriscalpium vulgare]|uniref:Uncharacterized protein n=1 Tax=Auriscalpium vulgare TaxID=40419 RepID=A0ACB8R648_9AGAM|nr:hypothetical protein FA95DRAFT_1612541 [Auriscalpium vulgare]
MVGLTKANTRGRKKTRGQLRLPGEVPSSGPGILRAPVPARKPTHEHESTRLRRPNMNTKRSLEKQLDQFENLNRRKLKKLKEVLDNAVQIDVDLRELAAIARKLTEDGVKDLLKYSPAFRSIFLCTSQSKSAVFFKWDHAHYLNKYATKFKPKMSADQLGRGAADGYRAEGENKIGCMHVSPGWHEIGRPNAPLRPSLIGHQASRGRYTEAASAAPGQATPPSATPSSDASGADAPTEPAEEPIAEVLFFVLLVIAWVNRIANGHSVKKEKHKEAKQVPNRVAVLEMLRCDLGTAALSVHDYQDHYAVGQVSGPPMRVYWSGSPQASEGKTQAPTIHMDAEWGLLHQLLKSTMSSVTSVNVSVDLDAMESFKTRKKALSPDAQDTQAELSLGTRVPNIKAYLKEERHLSLQLQRLDDAPDRTPLDLQFPRPLLLTRTRSLAMQGLGASFPRPPAPILIASSSTFGDCASSPPPVIEDELTRCLEAFGRARNIADEVIMAAVVGLDETGYSSDLLDAPTVMRIQELTGLKEGQAYQLQRFAVAWSGKIAGKRARRA